MTVVFTTADFWIESVRGTINFIAIDTLTDTPLLPLERSGRVIGVGAVTLDAISSSPTIAPLSQSLTVLDYGLSITGIIIRGMVRRSVPANVQAHAIVFLRK